jgi:hypothetical protein
MKIYCAGLASVLVGAMASAHAYAPDASSSLYTSITDKGCAKTIDDATTGAYTLKCRGIGGFRLHVLNDDERSSIDVVTPARIVQPLNYWELISTGFSSLGGKAEWRVRNVGGKTVPFALIIRVNTIDQSDLKRPQQVPYLAIAKIRENLACVVTKLDARAPGANARAREIADTIEKQPCLSVTQDATQP